MIPEFDADGNLPAGVHVTSWEEFKTRFGTNEHRRRLLTGMKQALESLFNAGCRKVYIDGSFVTSKEFPNDFDGCWEPVDVKSELLDPVLLKFAQGRSAQKAKYFGELFPNGIEGGSGKLFLDFFQVDKNTGKSKGIVAFELGGLK